MHQPKEYLGIMVSSTFSDLKDHRDRVIKAIQKLGFHPNVMEYSGPQAKADVLATSLSMVRDSAAYIGVISHKYGQTPVSPDHNPEGLSITELEFNEAMALKRPVLLFIMGEDHPLKAGDVELDVEKRRKLDAFRARAKIMQGGSELHRVYGTFNSLEQFSADVATAIASLAQVLPSARPQSAIHPEPRSTDASLPHPPALRAVPRYLGSHPFVGRNAELQMLSDWFAEADPNPILLFEAMGGTGKSMLTWEWATKFPHRARRELAGRFWYSFYEKDAVMTDFCRQALAYMTRRPAQTFSNVSNATLMDQLFTELEARPWLIVLDGLERMLVQYRRDPTDEEADTATNLISSRDPRQAIRPEDDDLLRRFAGLRFSKVLISTRLTPSVLVRTGTPVPGVRRIMLHGLRPPDAETMIRACGVRGVSEEIQAYLQSNCDCHPLVVGILGGLIGHYPRDRGNFDLWVKDPDFGASFDFASLDLIQRRNHILHSAIDALSPASSRLLQALALLQYGADFDTLNSLEIEESPNEVSASIIDLERRGLVQYEADDRCYDLHPIVRSVASRRMKINDTQELGRKIVNHLAGLAHIPWEQAKDLSDLRMGILLVRVLQRMHRHQEAAEALLTDLGQALFTHSAFEEAQALLRGFFPGGWDEPPVALEGTQESYLYNYSALSLGLTDFGQSKRLFERKLLLDMRLGDADNCGRGISNLAEISSIAGELFDAERLHQLTLELARATKSDQGIFVATLDLYADLVQRGAYDQADVIWEKLRSMNRHWERSVYRPGTLEYFRALHLFFLEGHSLLSC